MNPDLVSGRRFTRSRAAALGTAGLAVLLLGACEDGRVRAVDTGISRDSAIKIMSVDAKGGLAPGDSLPNIYRRSEYIIDAKRIEVLWFDPENRNPGKDTLPYRELTPVVLHDGKVIGRGWDFWDSTAVANRIWVEPKKK
jgi:hypothetical protein